MSNLLSHDAHREKLDLDSMTPREIVSELDNYIVGQGKAKRSVAIAIRNRIRRRKVSDDIREEIYPKNIIMIGPTGCGKTEIARRISRLTGAPFIKVEATKYTEVGYVGRDVESMVRDLAGISMNMVQKEFREKHEQDAKVAVEEKLLDLLLPGEERKSDAPDRDYFKNIPGFDMSSAGRDVQAGMTQQGGEGEESPAISGEEKDRHERVREMFRQKLRSGELESKDVEIDVQGHVSPMVQVLSGHSMEDLDMQVQNMLGDFMPKRSRKRRVTIEEARKILLDEELDRMLDKDKIQSEAIRRVEQMGIIFIDEIDKICGRGSSQNSGADVSREGVQRDLLPIVEGATVNTRNGPVKTDHILFIAAGAFHNSRPSDLIPELQGRFPIRVELEKLSEEDFRNILTGPQNSLTRQSEALLATEGIKLEYTEDGIRAIASFAHRVNEETENIGARRLHTIMEHLLDDVSFDAPDLKSEERHITINREFVEKKLHDIVEDRDLSQYIL